MYIRALDIYSYTVLTQRLLLFTERNCLPPTNKAYPKSNTEGPLRPVQIEGLCAKQLTQALQKYLCNEREQAKNSSR